jgi:hypothetical protein
MTRTLDSFEGMKQKEGMKLVGKVERFAEDDSRGNVVGAIGE